MYLHRQVGSLMLLVLLLPSAFCAFLAWRSGPQWLYLFAAAFLVIAWLFSSLTVQVNDRELVSWFGPGFWHVRAPLQRIVGVERTRSSGLEGWGIRITTRGMLYNVSGRDAVEIRLDDGRRFRLGTDDPDGLVAALRAHMAGRTSV
ncbi:MAG TPA: hypothetical protein VF034_06625 [Gemmatimonadaceae bacterium]|jgi:hypothetical protein